ncbi:TRAP transporter large permease subunit [Salmonella enterica subsp. enterica]|nr:TRAP transporter large permease subunit [Salmonella enterica subsp. enterica]
MGYVGVNAAMIMVSLSGSAVADIPLRCCAAGADDALRKLHPINRSVGLIAFRRDHCANYSPSIPFIIFGVSSGLSINRKLFYGGIAPNMMGAATCSLVVAGRAIKSPSQPKAT